MIRVLIVDDHPMVARYTQAEVALLDPTAQIVMAYTLAEAEAALTSEWQPDYILLDLMLPDADGLVGLVRLRGLCPLSVIAIVSGVTSPEVMRDCFFQGARGYLTKSTGADAFTEALGKLFANGFYYPTEASDGVPTKSLRRLTLRETEVLRALATGKMNKQLAPMLGISEATLKTYLRTIFEKLHAKTRVEAVRRGIELGLIQSRGAR